MTAKDLKNALLQEAVQGKLVPQIASEGNARDLLEKIRKERLSHGLDFANAKSGKKSKKETALAGSNPCDIPEDEIPFDIPESWCWCRQSDIANISTGMTPLKSESRFYEDGNIPWITSSLTNNEYIENAEYFITEYAIENTTLTLYPKNTLILAMYGQGKTRGQISELLIPATINQACAAIELFLDDEYLRKYIKLFHNWNYNNVRKEASGSAQPNLNLGKVQSTLIPLPPLAEQKRIVAAIEKFMPFIEEYGKKETVLNELNAQIGTLTKKAILQEAVQGKLVPPACRQAGKSPAKGLIKPEENWFFVYVIECKDGSFYKGFTENLEKRLEEHKRGIGADWTKTHGVKQLYYWEKVYTKEAAIKREKYLKSGIGREWFKKEVVEKPENWLDGHELLAKIRQQKQELIKEGNIKKEKPLPEITEDEIPCLPTGRPFDIPENWCWCRLGELGYTTTGSTPSKSNQNYFGDFIDFLSPGDIQNSIITYGKQGLSKSGYEVSRPTPKGTILQVCIGGSIGKCAITDREVTFNQQINSLTPIFSLSEYLFAVLSSDYFYKKITGNSTGTATPIINKSAWELLPIPLPPLAEQKRIVEAIEKMLPMCEKLGK